MNPTTTEAEQNEANRGFEKCFNGVSAAFLFCLIVTGCLFLFLFVGIPVCIFFIGGVYAAIIGQSFLAKPLANLGRKIGLHEKSAQKLELVVTVLIGLFGAVSYFAITFFN
jgi:hypothetical protein